VKSINLLLNEGERKRGDREIRSRQSDKKRKKLKFSPLEKEEEVKV
jgi:hypothetical protein